MEARSNRFDKSTHAYNSALFSQAAQRWPVRRELSLLTALVAFRFADAVTSYLPASGRVTGLREANPITLAAIERYGFPQAFLLLTAISLAFVGLFLLATYLEEIRLAHSANYRGVRRVRRTRIYGLACLVAITAFPVVNNAFAIISA